MGLTPSPHTPRVTWDLGADHPRREILSNTHNLVPGWLVSESSAFGSDHDPGAPRWALCSVGSLLLPLPLLVLCQINKINI